MLSIFAAIYERIAELRNTLYDKGVIDAYDTRLRTISIGNITAGGTGKTPLTAYVAKVLAERGEKVCILTRGYGRADAGRRVIVSDWENVLADAEKAGDEPLELARKLLGKAIVVADADRLSAAEMARRDLGVTAFVLDDGFQHRKIKRDLDIVCIDAADPFGGRKMLPAGRLREPLHNLMRADVIVITRAELVDDAADLQAELQKLSPNARVFVAPTMVVGVRALEEFHAEPLRTQTAGETINVGSKLKDDLKIDSKTRVRVGVFCAIGNPSAFFAQLRPMDQVELKVTRAFRDHHVYKQNDIDAFEAQAKSSGVDAILTTAKDAVKLREITFTVPCFVVEIEPAIENRAEFEALL